MTSREITLVLFGFLVGGLLAGDGPWWALARAVIVIGLLVLQIRAARRESR